MDKRFTQYILTLQFFKSILDLYTTETITFRNRQDKNDILCIFKKKIN